jgi:hypothetical protein
MVNSHADELDPVVGAEIQRAFSEEVVDKLRDVRL